MTFFVCPDYMRKFIHSLNNSKLLMGLAMLLLNIGTKYIELGLSKTQEQALRYALGRELLIFAVVFTATRDIIIAILLTAAFVVLSSFLLNEQSRFCVAPAALKRLRAVADLNADGEVSAEEERAAHAVLEKAKRQKARRAQSAFIGNYDDQAFHPVQ